MSERYEQIIEKNNAQIFKIKSFNRALRVENTHLKEIQKSEEIKKRKVGTISSSCRKDKMLET